MEVRNHRIGEIWHKQTSNVSANRIIVPSYIIVHYTTGWNADGSLNWLLGKAGGTQNGLTSAHVVVGRDGTAKQICPFNRRAWHAGESHYRDVSGLNDHGIGIEFVNPGWLKPDGADGWVDDYGNRRSSQELDAFGGFLIASHARVGGVRYAWPYFPRAQIDAGLEICRALIAAYKIKGILSHEEIDTRGWKTDPGPAFPIGAFTSLIEDERAVSAQPSEYLVDATRLNLRGGPGMNFDRIDPPGSLARNTRVAVRRRVDDWAYVEVVQAPSGADAGVLGWVNGSYLMRVDG